MCWIVVFFFLRVICRVCYSLCFCFLVLSFVLGICLDFFVRISLVMFRLSVDFSLGESIEFNE